MPSREILAFVVLRPAPAAADAGVAGPIHLSQRPWRTGEKFDRIAQVRLPQSARHRARRIIAAGLMKLLREFSMRSNSTPTAPMPRQPGDRPADKGRFREAPGEALAAIELEPQSPTAHCQPRLVPSTHGYDLAVSGVQEALAVEWDYPDAHLNLGLTLTPNAGSSRRRYVHEEALVPGLKDPVAKA